MNGSVPTWTAAVIITVAWHAVWWMGIVVKPQRPQAPPAEPGRLSYVPVISESHELGLDSGDVRTLWSPALFSLPSSVGFSRLMLSQNSGIKPPIDTVMRTDVRLPRLIATTSTEPDHTSAGLDPHTMLMQPPDRMSAAEFAAATPSASTPVLVLQTMPRTPALPDGVMKLPDPSLLGATAWMSPVEVSVSSEGWVDRVVINSPPEDPAAAATLTRALYRWRFEPGEERLFRLQFGYRPGAAPQTPAKGGGAS